MPERMARAQLVIARSGASTVAELSVMGRPSILVPYPHALDHDQARNAERLQDAGGAILTLQKNIGPVRLSQLLARLMEPRSGELSKMASAAVRLVDLKPWNGSLLRSRRLRLRSTMQISNSVPRVKV